MARLDSVLSFSYDPEPDQPTNDQEPGAVTYNDGGSDDDAAGFEFAFAPLLTAAGREAEDALAPADDLFAHGRILPAYPVFERRRSLRGDAAGQSDLVVASTAPPSPDTYCAWAPRSAPGSPARASSDLPKCASTGEARRFWRLRELVGGRSHSDGKDKFVFLQPGTSAKMPGKAKMAKQANKPSAPLQQQQQQKQSNKKKGKAGSVTEMDMATAHRLYYGKQGAGALPGAGGDRKQHSYLPYRTGIVGFFATAHALGRSHHPY